MLASYKIYAHTWTLYKVSLKIERLQSKLNTPYPPPTELIINPTNHTTPPQIKKNLPISSYTIISVRLPFYPPKDILHLYKSFPSVEGNLGGEVWHFTSDSYSLRYSCKIS